MNSDYWSWRASVGYAPNWYSFCAPYICARVTGDPKKYLTPWALATLFASRPEYALEIGCGNGAKLAKMVETGMLGRAHGVDVAAGAIASAAKAAIPGRLSFAVADLNTPELPGGLFDAVLANGVLHHIANLEVCCRALRDALMPGGWLIASEFTGPQRYRYSAEEVRAIHDGQALLPPALRGAPFDPQQLQPKLDADPTESVRTDIEPVLRATFEEVRAIPYGGNVLMRALGTEFFAGFDARNPEHAGAVARLEALDLEVSRRVPSHHHAFLARHG